VENWEIAARLEKIARLLALQGGNEYKIKSYQQAARLVSHLEVDVKKLVEQNKLKQLRGIGKALSVKIEEMVQEGESAYLKELQRKVPAGLLSLFTIPGVGNKTASLLVSYLQPNGLNDVLQAAREGRIREIPGLGPSLENRMVKTLEGKTHLRGTFHQGTALPVAHLLSQGLLQGPEVRRVFIAGDLRRGVEAVGEVVLVVDTSTNSADLAASLRNINCVQEVLPVTENEFLVNTDFGIPVKVHLATGKEVIPELWYKTGAPEHIKKVTAIVPSVESNFQAKEEDIYSSLGLEYVVPELREGKGEVEAAREHKLPTLVEPTDIQGDLHLHSNWSDGHSTVEDMAQEAMSMGYRYIAITDHSQSLKVAGGLTPEQILKQVEEIKELQHKLKNLDILMGIEVEILADGSLDLPDEVLSQLDLVIASIHSGFRQEQSQLTARMEAAISHPLVNVIGHPTGRIIGQREGYAVDLPRVFRAAAEYGTALEINSAPDRLDLSSEHILEAKEYGVLFSLGTDAHGIRNLKDMSFGVTTARRGWLTAEEIINTRSLEELRKILMKQGGQT